MKMYITPADYSKVKRMTMQQMSKFMKMMYQNAWQDGYDAAAKEICKEHGAVQIVFTDWIKDNCGDDVLNKIMEGVSDEE